MAFKKNVQLTHKTYCNGQRRLPQMYIEKQLKGSAVVHQISSFQTVKSRIEVK